jgi:hypothetical protein
MKLVVAPRAFDELAERISHEQWNGIEREVPPHLLMRVAGDVVAPGAIKGTLAHVDGLRP